MISDLWNIYERIEAAASPHRPQRQSASCDDEQRIEVDGDDLEEEDGGGDYRDISIVRFGQIAEWWEITK